MDDLQEQKKFLEKQVEWCREQDRILEKIHEKLLEMKQIAEQIAHHELTEFEVENLNDLFQKLQQEVFSLEVRLRSEVH